MQKELSKEQILKNLNLILMHGSDSKWASIGILIRGSLKTAINIGIGISKGIREEEINKIGTKACIKMKLKSFLALTFLEAPEGIIKINCIQADKWKNGISNAKLLIYNGAQTPIIQTIQIKKHGLIILPPTADSRKNPPGFSAGIFH